MLPSWISAPNASHRRIAPLDIETLGEPERAPSPKPTLAPIGPVGGSPVERSVTPPATKSGIGSLQSVAASMRTSVSEGAPKRGSIVERPSFAADVMGQNSPFRYEDSFKSPKLPSYAHIATAKSSSDRLGSKTVTLPKDPLRWDIPLQYGRRLHLPDEAEGPKFTDPSSFTKTASPYISIVKNEDCISMAMTEALATVPIVNVSLH